MPIFLALECKNVGTVWSLAERRGNIGEPGSIGGGGMLPALNWHGRYKKKKSQIFRASLPSELRTQFFGAKYLQLE